MVHQPEQRSVSSTTVDAFNTFPVTKVEFAAALTPCLSLCGGIGMNDAARKEWLQSAYWALKDIPADLIRQGAKVASLKADHPSKIVPAIYADIEVEWRWRQRRQSGTRTSHISAPEEFHISDEERDQVKAAMAALVKKLDANS